MVKQCLLQQKLESATQQLRSAGIEPAERRVRELIAAVMGWSLSELLLKRSRLLSLEEEALFDRAIARRLEGEPWQYIAGELFFYNSYLKVDRRALIPRNETELLVSIVCGFLQNQAPLHGRKLLDLGCGSGCMAIALKKAFPELTVVGCDLSPEALCLARENGEKNGVEIHWIASDLTEKLDGERFDWCVSNPPYIATQQLPLLEREVRCHEPAMALDGGEAGLAFYKRLALFLPQLLLPGGCCWLEMGYDQGEAVRSLFAPPLWAAATLLKDYAEIDRFLFAERS